MTGRLFDVQEELRIGGRASALEILLEVACKRHYSSPAELAQQALRHIGLRVGKEQGSPQCPESWLTGLHDIEQSLRQAHSTLTGSPPER